MEIPILNKDYELDLFDLQKPVGKIDITLKELFDIVYEAEIKNKGIAEALGMPNFDKFYEEISKPSQERGGEELHYIELTWSKNFNTKMRRGKLEEALDEAE